MKNIILLSAVLLLSGCAVFGQTKSDTINTPTIIVPQAKIDTVYLTKTITDTVIKISYYPQYIYKTITNIVKDTIIIQRPVNYVQSNYNGTTTTINIDSSGNVIWVKK